MKKITLMAAAIMLAMTGFAALAQIKVGVIVSSTGPGVVIGAAQRNTVSLLPTEVAGKLVEYLILDDGSDPATAVRHARRLIEEEKVDLIIGPSTTPAAMALIDVAAQSGTPLMANVGSAAVIAPMDDKRRWVYKLAPNDDLIAQALMEHMSRQGVKTLGFVGFNDPYGESWFKAVETLAEKAGIKIVASERYARGDSSVAGQVIRLLAARPGAVLVAAAGGPTVLPHQALVERGYKGAIYQTHGAATNEFIRLGGKTVEGALTAGSPMLILDELPGNDQVRNEAAKYVRTYDAKFGAGSVQMFGAATWDAGILLQAAAPEALKVALPGTPEFRRALRDAFEKQRNVVGAQGVYSMTPNDHNGLDNRARYMIRVDGGRWKRVQP